MYSAVSAMLRKLGTLNSPKLRCCGSTWRVFSATSPSAVSA